MHCDDIRRALPLDSGAPGENTEIHDHLSQCSECEQLAMAYAADARALSAYSSQREEAPAVMAGFADTLMARIAQEPVAEAPILKPEFGERSGYGTWVAIAAAVLIAIAIGIIYGNTAPDAQPNLADNDDDAPMMVTPTEDGVETPSVDTPVVVDSNNDTQSADEQPLAAPRRSNDRAPMPRLRRNRGGIVPVGDTKRPTLSNVLRDLQRVFPNWSPNGLDRRVPPLRKGEREVRF